MSKRPRPPRETWTDWIVCPVCDGHYYEKDVVCDDGTGPEYYCGYCKNGYVLPPKWILFHLRTGWWNLMHDVGITDWLYNRWLRSGKKP